MQFWGLPPIHPQTFAMADEVAHTAMMLAKFMSAVYALMLRDTVEEILIAVNYSE